VKELKTQPLQRQFRLWTTLLVIVPSLLIMMMYTIEQIKVTKQKNLEMISQRVEFQKQLIEYWVSERANFVRKLSNLEAFQTLDEQEMKSTLDVMQRYSKGFDSLSYIDKDGYFKLSTLSKGIKFPSTVGQPYFQAAVAGEEYISDVVIGRNSGLPIINFSSPIYDKEGSFQGLILGSVRTTTVETLLRDNWIGETGEMLLVNHEGTMLIEPRYNNVLVEKGLIEVNSKLKAKLPAEALRNTQRSEKGTGTWEDYLGKRVIGAYQRIPERNWIVIGSISEAEFLAPIYTQIGIMIGGTILLVILILPLATYFMNSIKNPIEWLIEQSNLIAAENYESVGRDRTLKKIPRELNILCETFVNMSHKIENTIGLLKVNEVKLESKMVEIQNVNLMMEQEIIERQNAQMALQQLNARLEEEVDFRTYQLQQSEQQYRKLVENSPDIICQFNSNCSCIYVNPTFSASTGIPFSQAVSKDWKEFGEPAEVCSQLVPHLEEVFRTACAKEFESKGWQWSESRDYSIRLVPECNQEGLVETILCIARDITDKKQLEKKITHLDRLNIVGEMAAAIGHEVRNPMTTVRGYLQVFQRKVDFTKYSEQLVTMIDEMDRANTIITEFLSLAKNKTVKKENGNFNKVLLTLLPLLQADAFCRGHEINVVYGDIPDSKFDEKEIRQLILNLVRNGFEAMENKGEVIVRSYLYDDSIVLEVQDKGKGIPEEVMDKIGIPFVTTKDGGTGLGLSVCYRIVDRHEGKIDITTGGDGTTVTIKFPYGS
jgi:two-component system, sporulation sensor kinase E